MRRTCLYCFDQFEPRSVDQEFCSRICRTLHTEESSLDGTDLMAPERIRRNIKAILEDEGSWLTEAYTLAIQAENLLRRYEDVLAGNAPSMELVI